MVRKEKPGVGYFNQKNHAKNDILLKEKKGEKKLESSISSSQQFTKQFLRHRPVCPNNRSTKKQCYLL